jgi:hypothetical protein
MYCYGRLSVMFAVIICVKKIYMAKTTFQIYVGRIVVSKQNLRVRVTGRNPQNAQEICQIPKAQCKQYWQAAIISIPVRQLQNQPKLNLFCWKYRTWCAGVEPTPANELPLSNPCRLMTRRYCKWATKWCAAIDWLRQLNLLIWDGRLFPVNCGNSRYGISMISKLMCRYRKMGGNWC